MKEMSRPAVEAAAFVGLATLPVVGLAVAAASQGGLSALPAAAPLAMFAPALAAIIVQKTGGGKLLGPDGLGLRMGRLRWWFAGLLGFAALTIASFVLTALIAPGAVASAAELRAAVGRLGGVPDLGTPEARGLAALGLTILIAPFLNLPLYLGEELGWRGFLAPRLTALLGRPGVPVTGAIWALWHLPLILLGHNYGTQPWLGMLVWLPLCMALSVLLTALHDRGGAIWPAALAHGVLNQLAALLTATVLVAERFTPLVDGAAGLAGLLVFGIAAVVVYRRAAPLDVSAGERGAVSQPRSASAASSF